MICVRCEEPILETDRPSPIMNEPFHWECGLRMAVGSIAHVEKRCSCFVPGSEEGDPPELTKRQAAQMVAEAIKQRQRSLADLS